MKAKKMMVDRRVTVWIQSDPWQARQLTVVADREQARETLRRSGGCFVGACRDRLCSSPWTCISHSLAQSSGPVSAA